ncbi:hypothetical protein BDF20DRAFT_221908 [Mycotypha africana]|uniref:uncharacterized protein n=1 Tax=Mycotypha africana TaxID=64632 RepID=UPI002301DF6E|nr:uncharacterized protein BDF20DRAFT_221908 [Mycotypha africana]KAI8967548.1 hypothetical protein BDF20DRAFT_221908 [Mycotypha africana]
MSVHSLMSADFEVSETNNGPGPCNGFPDYKDLPINQAFYLGAHKQQRLHNVAQMLKDGIRYLDINLCKHQGQIVVCSRYDGAPSDLAFTDIIEELFQFARNTVEQILILNVDAENVNEPVDTRLLETIIDEKCKIHTEATEGTDEFVSKECPFIYTHMPGKCQWPSMGELVNYNPEMAQWEGDGEVVGVRSKFIITKSNQIHPTPKYYPTYFTPKFWRSVPKENLIPEDGLVTVDRIKNVVNKECKSLIRAAGGGDGIGMELHGLSTAFNKNEVDPQHQQVIIEDIIAGKAGCNIDDFPMNTYFTFVSFDNYNTITPYLRELQKRMMKVNYSKWKQEHTTLEPSRLIAEGNIKQKVQRDEL